MNIQIVKMTNITFKSQTLSFFDFNIYTIPEVFRTEIISVSSSLLIIVRESDLAATEKELLVKILASVDQSMENAQVVSLPRNTTCRLKHIASNKNPSPLIIVFGLLPSECSLQVEKRPYSIIPLKTKNILFSHSLGELANLNDCKRALWVALKQHFKKD